MQTEERPPWFLVPLAVLFVALAIFVYRLDAHCTADQGILVVTPTGYRCIHSHD